MVMVVFFAMAPANITPTAIPSGMLCNVTASIIINVFFFFVDFISDNFSMKLLVISKKKTPVISPIVAGSHGIILASLDSSIAGNINDQMEAAIITPEAKPNSIFSFLVLFWFFMKNTIAEPRVVPIRGISIPNVTCIFTLPMIIYSVVMLWLL